MNRVTLPLGLALLALSTSGLSAAAPQEESHHHPAHDRSHDRVAQSESVPRPRGPASAAQRDEHLLQHWTRQLTLTEDQQHSLRSVLEQQRHDMQQVREATRSRIDALLTEDQKTTLAESRRRHESSVQRPRHPRSLSDRAASQQE